MAKRLLPRNIHRTVPMLIALSAAILGAASSHAQSEWKPSKNVEFVVPAGAGGGLDQVGRTVQRIMQGGKYFDATSTVVNKPGGGTAIGLNYVIQRGGDAHYLFVSSATTLSNYLLGITQATYTNLTPLARLFTEYVAITVRADSPFKTGRELAARMAQDPASVNIGIATSLGNHNHAGIAVPMKAAGVDIKRMKPVIFKSVGDAATALLGGHVDVVPSPLSVVAQHVSAGTIRVLGISAPRRVGGPYANAPTWKEQGLDIAFSTARTVYGPKGLTAVQVAFWDGQFLRLSQSEEWKKTLEKQLWENDYMNSSNTGTQLDKDFAELKAVLTDLGLAKMK